MENLKKLKLNKKLTLLLSILNSKDFQVRVWGNIITIIQVMILMINIKKKLY